jgi:uncharacterized integral membrane protein
MATPEPTDRPTDVVRPSRTDVDRRRQRRLIAALVVGVVVVVFAVINLNNVKVHWLVATGQTPLIVVIVLAFMLGMLADRLLVVRAKRKRGAES